jgi:hypothetical protein
MEDKTMKKLFCLITAVLLLAMLAGCAGTPVIYYTNCTCPTGGHTVPAPTVNVEGALKTGLYITAGIDGSKSVPGPDSTTEAYGEADFDVTMVAVLVDDDGIIVDCIIDGIAATVNFDGSGIITSDLTAPVQTKNELGSAYNMVAWGGAKAEWNEQAAALANFAIGKTVEELRNGAVDETGKAPAGSDLASSASIYLLDYVNGIEAAVARAKHLGAQAGDELKMATIASCGSSKNAESENAGLVQLDVDVTAVTVKGDIITSCYIGSLQGKVNFDANGTITSDITASVQSKNDLGAAYNMVAWGGAKAEWNEQAASFAAYATGKTVDEVMGIAVSEGKPADADLASGVTISITGFQSLIEKACE